MGALEHLRGVARRWPIVVLGGLGGLLLAVVLGPPGDPDPETTYEATHILFGSAASVDRGILEQAKLRVQNGAVPERTAALLGDGVDPDELADQVEVSISSNSLVLAIRTVQDTPERAAAIVDTVAEQLIAHYEQGEVSRRQGEINQLNVRLDELEQLLAAFDATIGPAGLPVTGTGDLDEDTIDGSSVTRAQREAAVREYSTLFERSQTLILENEQARSDQVTTNQGSFSSLAPAEVEELVSTGFAIPGGAVGFALLLAALGALLGAALAVLISQFDDRIYTAYEAERDFGYRVLAEIAPFSRHWRNQQAPIVLDDPNCRAAAGFRQLRTVIALNLTPPATPTLAGPVAPLPKNDDSPSGIVLVTSPTDGAGKTTVVANLAASLASAGRSVLVVSADLRTPKVHNFLGVKNHGGLTDVVAQKHHDTGLMGVSSPSPVAPGVHVVTHGDVVGNPSEVLAAATSLIADARESVDVVLVDTPSMAVHADVGELLSVATGIVIVAKLGATSTSTAMRTRDLADRLNADVMGLVLTAATADPERPRPSIRRTIDRLLGRSEGVPHRMVDISPADADPSSDRQPGRGTGRSTTALADVRGEPPDVRSPRDGVTTGTTRWRRSSTGAR